MPIAMVVCNRINNRQFVIRRTQPRKSISQAVSFKQTTYMTSIYSSHSRCTRTPITKHGVSQEDEVRISKVSKKKVLCRPEDASPTRVSPRPQSGRHKIIQTLSLISRRKTGAVHAASYKSRCWECHINVEHVPYATTFRDPFHAALVITIYFSTSKYSFHWFPWTSATTWRTSFVPDSVSSYVSIYVPTCSTRTRTFMQISVLSEVPSEVPLFFSLSFSILLSLYFYFIPSRSLCRNGAECWKRMDFVTVGGHGYLRVVENSSWINTSGQRADVRLLYYTKNLSHASGIGVFLDREKVAGHRTRKTFYFCVVHGHRVSYHWALSFLDDVDYPRSISQYNEIPTKR